MADAGGGSVTLSTSAEIGYPQRSLARGASLGRYLVIEPLGSGAAGIVYSAYDPQLDRRIAIKLLREPAPRTRARFLREMRALAQLQHRNVVTLYDADEIAGLPFLAMELCAGGTLSEWCSAQPRSAAELLGMFLEAGDGLAAAHVAGFVHRDFKPANVVIGSDGHPRVGDFGLVRADAEGLDEQADGGAGHGLAVTATGAQVGTLPYMALEQLRGATATAASDQFAYCVSLYAALFGARPFAGEDAEALARAIADGPRVPVMRSAVERRVWRVVRRGLAADPSARFSSMAELLAELRRARHRRAKATAAAAAAIAAAGALLFASLALRTTAEPCTGAAERLAGVWDAARKLRVERAFLTSSVAYAAATWSRVAPRLDGYRSAWTAMHTEACRATRVDGAQSERVLDLRVACLEQRRSELAALGGRLEHADSAVVERAIAAAAALSPVAACGDVATLRAQDGARRGPAIGEPWRARLADVKSQFGLGQWRDGLAAAGALVRDADARGTSATRAAARSWSGRLQVELGDYPAAATSLQMALQLASEAGDDALAAGVVSDLAIALGQIAGRVEQALIVADLGEAYVARAGNDDLQRAELLLARGEVLQELNRSDDARAAFERARALFAAHLPDSELRLARTLELLGRDRVRAEAYDDARPLYRRALDILQHQLGDDHPQVASVLAHLGVAEVNSGHFSAALDAYHGALAIDERVFGPRSLTTAMTLYNIGNVMVRLSRGDDAASYYEPALAIYEAEYGPNHLETATLLGNLGVARRMQGRGDEAMALQQRALAIRLAGGSQDTAYSYDNIGHLLFDRGDFADAEAQYRLAVAVETKDVPPDTLDDRIAAAEAVVARRQCGRASPELRAILDEIEARRGTPSALRIDALRLLGQCETDTGRPLAARPILERALAIAEPLAAHGDVNLEQLAVVRFELARALWASGADRPRAERLAAAAEAALAGPADPHDRARVVAWRRAHPPR